MLRAQNLLKRFGVLREACTDELLFVGHQILIDVFDLAGDAIERVAERTQFLPMVLRRQRYVVIVQRHSAFALLIGFGEVARGLFAVLQFCPHPIHVRLQTAALLLDVTRQTRQTLHHTHHHHNQLEIDR